MACYGQLRQDKLWSILHSQEAISRGNFDRKFAGAMLIGELAQETGLSKDTIRFYEKIGLIAAGERKVGSRIYKEFSAQTVARLSLILKAKKLGFKLSELKQTLDSWEDGSLSYSQKIQIMQDKMADIDAQIEQLEGIKDYLGNKVNFLRQQQRLSS